MTTSSAPCTTLSVMSTMSDLTDDFRLHAFAAGLSLLHHRFDRAQVFVDFANKSADAPTATLSKAEALSHSLIAILRRARVLRGESSISVLRYGTDASKYEALLARAFGVDATEAARLASATVSSLLPARTFLLAWITSRMASKALLVVRADLFCGRADQFVHFLGFSIRYLRQSAGVTVCL